MSDTTLELCIGESRLSRSVETSFEPSDCARNVLLHSLGISNSVEIDSRIQRKEVAMLKAIVRTVLVVGLVLIGMFAGTTKVAAKDALEQGVAEKQKGEPLPEEKPTTQGPETKTPDKDAVRMTCNDDTCDMNCAGHGQCGVCNSHGACICFSGPGCPDI
jgi:hypothetical protein